MLQETNVISAPVIIPEDRQLTLSALFELWDRAAAGEQIPYTDEQLFKLVELKADDYRIAHDFAASEAEVFRGYAKEMQEKAQAAAARAERIKSFLCAQMAARGLTKISGKFFSARVQEFKSTEVDFDYPSQEDAMRWPLLVKPKFEWSKTSIKEAIEKGETFSFARMVSRPKIVFTAVKGGDK